MEPGVGELLRWTFLWKKCYMDLFSLFLYYKYGFQIPSDCCWFLREVIGSFWKCGHPWKDPIMKVVAIVPKALGDEADFQIPKRRHWSTSEHVEEM